MRIKIDPIEYKASVTDDFLGYIGETNSRPIIVDGCLTPGANVYKLRLTYKDDVSYDVPIVNGIGEVSGSLLRMTGDLKGQVIAIKEDGDTFEYVKKSNIFTISISESLTDDTEAIPTYEESTEALEKVLGIESSILASVDERVSGVVEKAQASAENAEKAQTAAQSAADSVQTIAESIPEDYSELSGDVTAIYQATFDVSANLLNTEDSDFIIGKRFANLTTSYIMDANNFIISGFIPCKSGDIVKAKYQYQGSNIHSFAFYDENRKYLSQMGYMSSENTRELETVAPENTAYVRLCCYTYTNNEIEGTWSEVVMVTINNDIPSDFIPYGQTILKDNFNAEKAYKMAETSSERTSFEKAVTFFCPSTIYGIKNRLSRPRKIPIENLIIGKNIDDFYTEQNEYSVYTNKGNDAIVISDEGEGTPVYIKGKVTGETYFSKTLWAKFIKKDELTNPSAEKNVLIIGDSFTDMGVLPCEIKRNLTIDLGLSNLNFVGHKEDTNDDITCKNCGVGGITLMDYIKTDNSQGRPETTWNNPFLYDGEVSVKHYMSQYTNDDELDIVVIECGVNDLITGISQYDTIAQTTVERMKSLVDIVHTQYPDCKVFCVGQKYANNIQTSINALAFNKLVVAMNAGYSDLCNGSLYSSFCTYVDIALLFDSVHFSPYQMKNIYKGSDETVRCITDWLHPNTAGFYEIAEQIAGAIAYTLFKT
jgi:lysophospholipase L1-like esterase